MRSVSRATEAITDLTAMKLGSVIASAGLVGLILSATWLSTPSWASGVSGQLGGLLLVTGLLGLGWEKMGKRELAEEVLAKAGLAERVRSSGLAYVGRPYADPEEWSKWLSRAKAVDIAMAYGETWRNANRDSLERLRHREGGVVRVLLPDYSDLGTIQPIAARFGIGEDALVQRIKDAAEDFQRLFSIPGGCRLDLRYRRGELLYNVIRCDEIVVVTLFSHTRERRTNPPILGFEHGTMRRFLVDEFSYMHENGTVKPTDAGIRLTPKSDSP